MVDTFNCPACGGPLEYTRESETTIRCPYCYNTVIVPEELRGKPQQNRDRSGKQRPEAMLSTALQFNVPELQSEIRELLAEERSGDKTVSPGDRGWPERCKDMVAH
jgi:LSD1 subclass zinc finger protein